LNSGTIPEDDLAWALAGMDDEGLVGRVTALLMAADEAFWLADLRSRTVWVSRNMQVSLGHSRASIGSALEAWRDLVHPDDRPRVVRAARSAIVSGAPTWLSELRVRRADGTYALVRVRATVLRDADGGPVALAGSVADLTERVGEAAELQRRTDQLLEGSARMHDEETRRRFIERAVDEVVWEWDVPSGTVAFSENLATLFGYGPEQIDGTLGWWEERLHPDDQAGTRHSLAMHLADELEEWVGIYRFRRSDGAYVWVRDRGYLERYASGDPWRMVGSMRILDERRDDQLIADPRRVRLTPRQSEVLHGVRGGYSNKQIASELGIGEQSVKEHVSRLLQKFAASNRAALVEASWRAELAPDRGPPAVSG